MPRYIDSTGALDQGDVYDLAPSIRLEDPSIRVARVMPARPADVEGARRTAGVHEEGGQPPQNGWQWEADRGGELLIARGFLTRAVVISHECEIENDQSMRLLAMVRPLSVIQGPTPEETEQRRADVMDFRSHCNFPLHVEGPFLTEPAFVDFRRITAVKPVVIESRPRLFRLSEETRKAMADHFWEYLWRRV